MYQVIIYKGVNWKKDEKTHERYKKIFSTNEISLDESTEIYEETRNLLATAKDIYVQQIENRAETVIINEFKTNPDGKDISYNQSTVKEEIEQYKDQDIVVTIFDYRVGKFIVDKLPIEEMCHLWSVLDLYAKMVYVEDNELNISVNS